MFFGPPYRLYSKPAYGFHVFFSCFSCFGMPVAPWAFNVFHCPGPSVLRCFSAGSVRDNFFALRHRTPVSQRLTEASRSVSRRANLSHADPYFSVSRAKRFAMFFGRFAARQIFCDETPDACVSAIDRGRRSVSLRANRSMFFRVPG